MFNLTSEKKRLVINVSIILELTEVDRLEIITMSIKYEVSIKYD